MALLNRILSVLLALALLLGGLLAAVEIVLALLGRPSWVLPHEQWSTWLGEQTWDTDPVRAGLVALALLGLLLLWPALRRGKPSALSLPPRSQGTPAGVSVSASRRGIETSLATAARRTSGVSAARAQVSRRRATVRARTATRSPGTLHAEVSSAVTETLTDLGLAEVLRPRVTISTKAAR
ncbi:hypothetical protein FE251_02530 [Georgenia wutianyii]|uniref:DUF6286 domain-containing protein n=1 Tax=Georgenia wutianyii TaxID=2585135 RepID=A0ABX5VJ22_9MICO|nr:DUF6286 domain-containing protein [Georgenia wutianyii]QDB78376.1 hypothetical protein FE251_02530 [Georgenia wutianyii]